MGDASNKRFDGDQFRKRAGEWLSHPLTESGLVKRKKQREPKAPKMTPDATDALLREKSRQEIDTQVRAGKGRYGAGLFGSFIRQKP